jgi:Bacterial capsule synthesis protein PGA_cap.
MPRQKPERFYQNDDAPGFLKDLGFNLFQMANNHAFDWGEAGYQKPKMPWEMPHLEPDYMTKHIG